MRKRKTILLALFILLAAACSFLFATYSHAITITGSDTITKNSSSQYTASGCNGTVSWNVTGTGASISSNAVLTTGSASCGGITVTSHCSDGSIATKTARVTDAGRWVVISDVWAPYSCTPGVGTCCDTELAIATEISGKDKFLDVWRKTWGHDVYGCTISNCISPKTTQPPMPSGACLNRPDIYTLRGYFVYHQIIYEWQCPSCTTGQTISCYSGASETKGVGECKAGTQTCVNGQWGACVGEVLPQAEICGDGKDNNCNGLVDEGCCEVSVKVSPSAVWPLIPEKQRPKGYSLDKTKADVIVTLTNPAPSEGCTINLKVEPEENSGGHGHDGNRPKGTVYPEVITFSGGTIGAQNAKYKSSEIAGEEKIVAEIKGEKKNETTIIVRVPNLYSVPSGNYRFTGQRTVHPDNHYGTYYTVVNTRLMGEDYYEQFKATLGINDMSLKWGGLFDIGPPDGPFWSPPHSSHRKGTSVDISKCAQSVIPDNPNPRDDCSNGWIKVNKKIIGRKCFELGKGWLVKEETMHCEFPYVE